ncbi:CotH kinase family protein [Sporosarcina ureilytica]|uniref:GH29D-like beta-sandwich domain-containing protein n=1 Tax=Sporosarcina ureilytica TaxID=298596 RepID=A0A1D8JJ72_9BACL|nr:CotH kinase family protein [Sporosarcina ureilytica]AOV08758.1 hypothetical protein BI350_15210 [Sporosarcina ureilytica]
MRKTVYISIIIIVISLFWGGFYYVADKGVDIDPMIEQHVKDEFKTENVSKRLLQSIEVLDLSNKNLTSIQGLEAFTNLKELNLSGNLLTDARPLAELEYLTIVDLSFNQLSELELASEHIEKLDLEANRLVEIEFIKQLPMLKNLNVRANNVVDLTPLTALSHLEKLNIRGNQIRSLEPLAHMLTLTDLNAQNNQIQSVQPIENLQLEKRLYLTGNDISDLYLLEDKLDSLDEFDFEIPIPKPTFRVQSGIYTEPFELELRTAEYHQIYYTLDGSKPTIKANKYTGPIEISKELMLEQPINANHKTSPLRDGFSFEPEDVKKAITVTAASYIKGEFSESISQTYILDEDLVNRNLPIISLVVQPKDFFDEDGGIYIPGNMFEDGYIRTGNYYQKGRQHEKESTMEYFHEDGELSFRQTVGLRINGSYTRVLPQKSLRIYPRSDYGQSRIYAKIFDELPYHEFNLLVLRNSGNDSDSTMMRDGLMHELVKDRGIDVQAYKPAIVLLNGEYWGIHNIREKFSEDYIDIKYNVKNSDLVMMSVAKKAEKRFVMDAGKEKDRLHYVNMLDYIRSNDMTQLKHVEYVDTQMDINNFLEYVAYEVYYGNTDSFSNNMTVWRKRTDYVPNAPLGHDGRWRWMLFDLDWGMGYGLLGAEGDPITYNMLEDMLSDKESVELFRLLMENQALKDRFAGIMLSLLNENFKPEHVHDKIDELAAKIRPEMPHMIERWENIESIEVWEDNIELLHRFADERPTLIRKHLKETFGYTDDELENIESSIEK